MESVSYLQSHSLHGMTTFHLYEDFTGLGLSVKSMIYIELTFVFDPRQASYFILFV